MNHDFLMNLPTHIFLEILSWLPAKTIIQCKSVCKLWHETINDSRARPGLVVHDSATFRDFSGLVDFEDSNDHHDKIPHDTMLKFSLKTLGSYPDANIVVDGSVNGFLFLRDINYKHETLYVCNPLTREYFQIPKPVRIARYPGVVTHGFGVTSSSGEYKVVRINHDWVLDSETGDTLWLPRSECRVYTLGKGRVWRTVKPAPFSYNSGLHGLFFKGNVHWLVQELEGHDLISSFNLQNETFHPFPGPFPCRRLNGSLGVLRDCLCLCDKISVSEIDIWVMKEYGVEKSWIKEIAIAKMPSLIFCPFEIAQALKIFRDGTILILWGGLFMLCCCSESNVAIEVDMGQPRESSGIEAIHYVPSFASLGRFVMENVITF